ncbi:hypothetical protein NDA18_003937 [Ustilago nuda]|nr:hypothetical protein NDA18_003937 [Ustilago nuda]
MPRKRKAPKREPSEGGSRSNISSNTQNDTANVASTCMPAPSAFPSTHRQPTAEPCLVASLARQDTTNVQPSKRARLLSDNEEDRLGKLVGLERWVESVGHGRGAAVSICGQVTRLTPSTSSPSLAAFLVELSCFQPNNPGQRSELHIRFQGQLAQKVAEPLLLLHRLGPPAVIYISGFAAQLSHLQQDMAYVIFKHDQLVLKMSPQPPSHDLSAPTSAIWIEQLATHPILASATTAPPSLRPQQPSTHVQLQPAAGAAANPVQPSPPSQLSDWFSTPDPSGNAPVRPNAVPVTTVAAENILTMAALPPAPSQPAHPQAMQPPAAASSVVKSEAQAGTSSSSTSCSRPGRAASRQASAAPQPPCRNAPNVKPKRMGNCIYTPMSMVRDGERASFVGVVVAAGDPRRSTSGTRDLGIKITIADASCLSGTGYAKQLVRSITVMLFAQQAERIPQNIAQGHIFAVRSVQVQMFSGKPQAVGKSAANWSWATYNPVSGDLCASSNFPLASHTPPECSAEEMEHFREMANSFSELQGVDANVVTRSCRPTLKLKHVSENSFFDTVVEVLKVYTHTLAPDLYVTDYTNHSLFYRGNDKYLRLESEVPYPDDTDGWGHVFQISLWDSHATIAEGLQTGDIIRIQNVRPKLNPRGLLTGGLGSSTDSGIKIRTLKLTDEARVELEQRRARFMETLFVVEEEAVADQVERKMQSASQQQRQAEQIQLPAPMIAQQAETSAARPVAGQSANAVSDNAAASDTAIQVGLSAAQAATFARTQESLAPRVEGATEASLTASTQPPFPTPAQRQIRAMQQITPSRSGNSSKTKRDRDDLSLIETPDLKAGMLMGPPGAVMEERRPLIRCNAPASIPLTGLAELQTSSLCPGMYKVKGRIISTNPAKVEQWARLECKACKRLLPLDQRFCTKCEDEDGECLSYCLRFAIMLEEVDAEFVARKQQQRRNQMQTGESIGEGSGESSGGSSGEGGVKKVAIPLLFHGRSSDVLLACVDAKALFNGERSCIKTLKRFHARLLHPQEYGKHPEQVLAVYSFPSKEAGRTVRRFAALKELNCLHNPLDLL